MICWSRSGSAPARITHDDQAKALADHIDGGTVAGIPVAQLSDQATRDRAYTALETAGQVPPAATDDEVAAAIAAHRFYEVYTEQDPAITDAAQAALNAISLKVGVLQVADLGLDGLSLAAIYFLAAIGLAITFGVMGVINMAHGEFITMGAYTGYVVQQIVPGYTASLIVAFPLAFAVTFAAGVAMERLVIRHLYKRPLETLLATFGISIALQQVFKNIFGTQARPLTSPDWLGGALTFNDVVSISYIRIAIIVLAAAVPGLLSVSDEADAAGAGGAGCHAEPGDGRLDGHQPRPHQHADLRPWLRHRGHRRRGAGPLCQGHLRTWH